MTPKTRWWCLSIVSALFMMVGACSTPMLPPKLPVKAPAATATFEEPGIEPSEVEKPRLSRSLDVFNEQLKTITWETVETHDIDFSSVNRGMTLLLGKQSRTTFSNVHFAGPLEVVFGTQSKLQFINCVFDGPVTVSQQKADGILFLHCRFQDSISVNNSDFTAGVEFRYCAAFGAPFAIPGTSSDAKQRTAEFVGDHFSRGLWFSQCATDAGISIVACAGEQITFSNVLFNELKMNTLSCTQVLIDAQPGRWLPQPGRNTIGRIEGIGIQAKGQFRLFDTELKSNISMRDCTFENGLLIGGAELSTDPKATMSRTLPSVQFEYLTTHGAISFQKTTTHSTVTITGVTTDHAVEISECTFNSPWDGTSPGAAVGFEIGTSNAQSLNLSGSELFGSSRIMHCQFQDGLSVQGSVAGGKVSRSQVHGSMSLGFVTALVTTFDDCDITGDLQIVDSKFHVFSMGGSNQKPNDAHAAGVVIGSKDKKAILGIIKSEVDTVLLLDNVQMHGSIDLAGSVVGMSLNMQNHCMVSGDFQAAAMTVKEFIIANSEIGGSFNFQTSKCDNLSIGWNKNGIVNDDTALAGIVKIGGDGNKEHPANVLLDNAVIGVNLWIRQATIQGDLVMRGTHVGGEVVVSNGTNISGEWSAERAIVDGTVSCMNSRIDGGAFFNSARLGRLLVGDNDADSKCIIGTKNHPGGIDCGNAEIKGGVEIAHASLYGPLSLARTRTEGNIRVGASQFVDDGINADSLVAGTFIVFDTSFQGSLNFAGTRCQSLCIGSANGTTSDPVTIGSATDKQDLKIDNADVAINLILTDITISGNLSLTSVSVHKNLVIRHNTHVSGYINAANCIVEEFQIDDSIVEGELYLAGFRCNSLEIGLHSQTGNPSLTVGTSKDPQALICDNSNIAVNCYLKNVNLTGRASFAGATVGRSFELYGGSTIADQLDMQNTTSQVVTVIDSHLNGGLTFTGMNVGIVNLGERKGKAESSVYIGSQSTPEGINIQNSNIGINFNLYNADVFGDVRLTGTRIGKGLYIKGKSVIEGVIDLEAMDVGADIDIQGMRMIAPKRTPSTEDHEEIAFDATGIAARADFTIADDEIVGPLSFEGAKVDGLLAIYSTRPIAKMNMNQSTLGQGLKVQVPQMGADPSAKRSQPGTAISAHAAEVRGDIMIDSGDDPRVNTIKILGDVNFQNATILGDFAMHHARLNGSLVLEGVTIDRKLDLKESLIDEDLNLRSATVKGELFEMPDDDSMATSIQVSHHVLLTSAQLAKVNFKFSQDGRAGIRPELIDMDKAEIDHLVFTGDITAKSKAGVSPRLQMQGLHFRLLDLDKLTLPQGYAESRYVWLLNRQSDAKMSRAAFADMDSWLRSRGDDANANDVFIAMRDWERSQETRWDKKAFYWILGLFHYGAKTVWWFYVALPVIFVVAVLLFWSRRSVKHPSTFVTAPKEQGKLFEDETLPFPWTLSNKLAMALRHCVPLLPSLANEDWEVADRCIRYSYDKLKKEKSAFKRIWMRICMVQFRTVAIILQLICLVMLSSILITLTGILRHLG